MMSNLTALDCIKDSNLVREPEVKQVIHSVINDGDLKMVLWIPIIEAVNLSGSLYCNMCGHGLK